MGLLVLYERKVNRQTFFNIPDFVRVFTHRNFVCLFAVVLPLISVKQPTKNTKLVERYHQKSSFKTSTCNDLLSVRIVCSHCKGVLGEEIEPVAIAS